MGLFGNSKKETKVGSAKQLSHTASYSYEIPKGTTVKSYLADAVCEECGCKTLREAE
jgi:hypothetical protein